MPVKNEHQALDLVYGWTKGNEIEVSTLAECVNFLSNSDDVLAPKLLREVLDYFEHHNHG